MSESTQAIAEAHKDVHPTVEVPDDVWASVREGLSIAVTKASLDFSQKIAGNALSAVESHVNALKIAKDHNTELVARCEYYVLLLRKLCGSVKLHGVDVGLLEELRDAIKEPGPKALAGSTGFMTPAVEAGAVFFEGNVVRMEKYLRSRGWTQQQVGATWRDPKSGGNSVFQIAVRTQVSRDMAPFLPKTR